MMPQHPNIKREFVPSTDLFNGWNFIKVSEDGTILGIKVMIIGLHNILTPDGTPAKNPDGTQVYAVESTNHVRNFTFKEYQAVIKSQEISKE